jgi:hypothetical protein
MKRFHQILLIGSFLPLCWLWMMVVHELGHVVGLVTTGGMAEKVILHPLAISRTDAAANPHPLIVVWAGPVFGILLPLVLAMIVAVSRFRWAYLVRFFAGVCSVANGCYIGVGSFGRVGDAGDMLRNGSPIWTLWLFGLLTVPVGLYLWNGLGPKFGLGLGKGEVDHRAAYVCGGLLFVTVVLEVVFSST